MATLNKVTLIGYLGRDPELRYTAEGKAVCRLSVATTSKWKDSKTGEQREETEWHRVVILNRLAEIAGEYLKKGRQVYIEGNLKTHKWTDKGNIERYSTEIIADLMQMLDSNDKSADKKKDDASANNAPVANKPKAAPSADVMSDEDLPF